MAFDQRPCSIEVVADLCERFHGYGGSGKVATYAFAVYEDARAIAAFAWQPPPPGASRAVCPEEPSAVLSLSRMVAIPREDRRLRHISKPLREQQKRLIDRTRWPVLVTYSDEGEGHNGYTYECAGWEATERSRRPIFVDANGTRASSYSNGAHGGRDLRRAGTTTVQRWEHWIVERGRAAEWMAHNGWRRVSTSQVWRSGNRAFSWERAGLELDLFGGAP